MGIKEIKKWAKSFGYTITKEKQSDDLVQYTWFKDDNTSINGIERSVSKVAKAVYNHISNNQWLDYQKTYAETKDIEHFSITTYGA